MDWQPMATAPKDGTHILIYERSTHRFLPDIYVVNWRTKTGDTGDCTEAAGEEYYTWEPTHWMPLPPPPKEQGTDKSATNPPDKLKMSLHDIEMVKRYLKGLAEQYGLDVVITAHP